MNVDKFAASIGSFSSSVLALSNGSFIITTETVLDVIAETVHKDGSIETEFISGQTVCLWLRIILASVLIFFTIEKFFGKVFKYSGEFFKTDLGHILAVHVIDLKRIGCGHISI